MSAVSFCRPVVYACHVRNIVYLGLPNNLDMVPVFQFMGRWLRSSPLSSPLSSCKSSHGRYVPISWRGNRRLTWGPVFCLQDMYGLFQDVPVNTPVPRHTLLTDIRTFLRNPLTVTSQTGWVAFYLPCYGRGINFYLPSNALRLLPSCNPRLIAYLFSRVKWL